MSFCRDDYEQVYRFAVSTWMITPHGSNHEKECESLMDLCEAVIGQQSDRPDRSLRNDE